MECTPCFNVWPNVPYNVAMAIGINHVCLLCLVSPRLDGVVPLGPPRAPAELELCRAVVLPLFEQSQVPEVVHAVPHRGDHPRGNLQESEPVVPEGINFSFQGGAELMLGGMNLEDD